MPNVLITGTSTGIGEACTRHFAGRGYTVFAGVRREEDATRDAADLQERSLAEHFQGEGTAGVRLKRGRVGLQGCGDRNIPIQIQVPEEPIHLRLQQGQGKRPEAQIGAPSLGLPGTHQGVKLLVLGIGASILRLGEGGG